LKNAQRRWGTAPRPFLGEHKPNLVVLPDYVYTEGINSRLIAHDRCGQILPHPPRDRIVPEGRIVREQQPCAKGATFSSDAQISVD
jgi:hypothetical protein